MARAKTEETVSHLGELVQNGPFGTPAVAMAAIHKIGDIGTSSGLTSPGGVDGGGEVDYHTMFGEGSVGKVRFAGLAYMLQQEGKLDMKMRVADFFSQQETLKFLVKKYGEEGAEVAQNIRDLFKRDDNKDATLADLTTHFSGVGDNTQTNLNVFQAEGIGGNWSIIRQLAHINRAEDGVVQTFGAKPAKGGAHQYSNLGYTILGEIIEAAANRESEHLIPFNEIFHQRMTRPLGLTSTKFADEVTPDDKLAKSQFSDPSGKIVDTVIFQGAGRAGGMFASAKDMQVFFAEFFRGFPGTPEYGASANKFFSDSTIEKMKIEWEKHDPAGITESGNLRFQGAGFVIEKDASGKILAYDKGGETHGYKSTMRFLVDEGKVEVKLEAFENVSPLAIAALPKFIAEKIVSGTLAGGENLKDESVQKRIAEVEAQIKESYSPEQLQFQGKEIVATEIEKRRDSAALPVHEINAGAGRGGVLVAAVSSPDSVIATSRAAAGSGATAHEHLPATDKIVLETIKTRLSHLDLSQPMEVKNQKMRGEHLDLAKKKPQVSK